MEDSLRVFMASVTDSFREIFSEQLSFVKLVALTVPVYFCYQIYMTTKNDYTGFSFIAIITTFFFFGYLTEITNNIINERSKILPPFNPIFVGFSGLKGLIALFPVTLISSLIANYACSFINTEIDWLTITFKTFIWLLAISFIGSSFLLFAAKERIFEAFRLNTVFRKAADFLLMIIFFLVQLLFANILTFGFVGYTLYILFGFGVLFDIFVTFAVVFNLTVLAHYLGQAYYEIIGYEVGK